MTAYFLPLESGSRVRIRDTEAESLRGWCEPGTTYVVQRDNLNGHIMVNGAWFYPGRFKPVVRVKMVSA